MSTKRPERPGGNIPPTKKTKEKSVEESRMSSAEDRLQSLPGGRCLHCNQDCTLESNALQRDLCQNWVYSECEGISSELYKQLNDVCSGIIKCFQLL